MKTTTATKRLYLPRDTAKSRKQADRELRHSFIEGTERTIQNVIHDHCYPGADATFTTAEVVKRDGGIETDWYRFIEPLLRGAERVGAIRSTGPGTWIVVDEDQLYRNDLKQECRAIA